MLKRVKNKYKIFNIYFIFFYFHQIIKNVNFIVRLD
jgi:hypothetical protein